LHAFKTHILNFNRGRRKIRCAAFRIETMNKKNIFDEIPHEKFSIIKITTFTFRNWFNFNYCQSHFDYKRKNQWLTWGECKRWSFEIFFCIILIFSQANKIKLRNDEKLLHLWYQKSVLLLNAVCTWRVTIKKVRHMDENRMTCCELHFYISHRKHRAFRYKITRKRRRKCTFITSSASDLCWATGKHHKNKDLD
jgi:hypothetical protein